MGSRVLWMEVIKNKLSRSIWYEYNLILIHLIRKFGDCSKKKHHGIACRGLTLWHTLASSKPSTSSLSLRKKERVAWDQNYSAWKHRQYGVSLEISLTHTHCLSTNPI